MMKDINLSDKEYRDKYRLNGVCVNDRFPKFCIWCSKHNLKPMVKMNDLEVCFEAITSDERNDYCVVYPVDDFDFYGSDNFQQIIIEDMERLMSDG